MEQYNEYENTTELDEPITTDEVATVNAFLGEIPLEVLLRGIDHQFESYLDLDDTTNYVEIFYQQYDASIANADAEDEEHPAEIKEFLSEVLMRFTNHMLELMDKRLAIHPNVSDDDIPDDDQYRQIFTVVYEGMILNAKKNFTTAITKDILSKIDTQLPKNYTDDQWYDTIHGMLEGYSPVIVEISPLMFLKYIGNTELISMYEDGILTGNFLRKYSPRLYENEEYEVELVSNITLTKDVKEDLVNATTGTNPAESAD